MSAEKFVRYVLDPNKPLSAEQMAEIEVLVAREGEPVDTSDIPPLDDAFWENAVLSPLYQIPADGMPVRIDPDIALWLRASGRGFDRRLNAILREAMTKDIGEAGAKPAAKPKPAVKRSA